MSDCVKSFQEGGPDGVQCRATIKITCVLLDVDSFQDASCHYIITTVCLLNPIICVRAVRTADEGPRTEIFCDC